MDNNGPRGVGATGTTEATLEKFFVSNNQPWQVATATGQTAIDAAAFPVSVAAAHCTTSGLQQWLGQAACEQPDNAAIFLSSLSCRQC